MEMKILRIRHDMKVKNGQWGMMNVVLNIGILQNVKQGK